MDDMIKFPQAGSTLDYAAWAREAHSRIINEIALLTQKEQSEVNTADMLISIHKEVVIKALIVVERNQPANGKFNLNIIFNTSNPDVIMPGWVKNQYPLIMNVVLNNQYDHLHVKNDGFEVNVYMNERPIYLYIPINSIFVFKDNIHNFSAGFVKDVPAEIDKAADQVKPEESIKDNIVSLADYRKSRNSERKD